MTLSPNINRLDSCIVFHLSDIGESSSASPVRGSPLKNGGRSPASSHSPEKTGTKYSPVKSTNKSVLDASENVVLNSSTKHDESSSSVVTQYKTVVHTSLEHSEYRQERKTTDSEGKNLHVEVVSCTNFFVYN